MCCCSRVNGFLQTTNRLAVGLVDNTIVLYDLTTTSKLRVFKGHEGRPSCICFNTDGDHLASYSAQESQARIWQVCGVVLLDSAHLCRCFVDLHGHIVCFLFRCWVGFFTESLLIAVVELCLSILQRIYPRFLFCHILQVGSTGVISGLLRAQVCANWCVLDFAWCKWPATHCCCLEVCCPCKQWLVVT